MRRARFALIGVFALLLGLGHALAPEDAPVGDKFRQLEELLPTPNEQRAASGAPGSRYWQQRADYSIDVALDEDARTLTGSEVIRYWNQSPDELAYIWVQLDMNIFSFSVDEGSARVLWAKGSFSSVDLGLVEIAYTEANEARREQMWAIRDAIVDDLLRRFPALAQNDDSKYSIVLAQLVQKLPLLPWMIRTGLGSGEAVCFAAVCGALIVLLAVALVRRAREDGQRTLARPAQFRAKRPRAGAGARESAAPGS